MDMYFPFWTSFIVLSYLLKYLTIIIYCCDNNYLILSYFVYYDLRNWCYGIIFETFWTQSQIVIVTRFF